MDDVVIAVFPHHQATDLAIRRLVAAGWERADLSVVGKRSRSSEGAVAFHRTGEPTRFLGSRGTFWEGLWSLFDGGLLLTLLGVGIVVVLGRLAAAMVFTVERDAFVERFGALGGLLIHVGVPLDSLLHYEDVVKHDGFLVMAHGSTDRAKSAQHILDNANPLMLEIHHALEVALAREIIPTGSAEAFPQRWV